VIFTADGKGAWLSCFGRKPLEGKAFKAFKAARLQLAVSTTSAMKRRSGRLADLQIGLQCRDQQKGNPVNVLYTLDSCIFLDLD
jgi:hypothetical protein